MFAIRKGNTITIAPLEDALVGLQSGWAIRFSDKPQFLFHISRKNLDGSKMTMDQAIENCARIARREGLDLRSNACTAQVFELAPDGEHKACELLGLSYPPPAYTLPAVKLVQDRLAALEAPCRI
jgi:hypothetical protein